MQVAGGPGESIVQPLWSDAGLTFISDRTDWWNIYTETGPGEVCLHKRETSWHAL